MRRPAWRSCSQAWPFATFLAFLAFLVSRLSNAWPCQMASSSGPRDEEEAVVWRGCCWAAADGSNLEEARPVTRPTKESTASARDVQTGGGTESCRYSVMVGGDGQQHMKSCMGREGLGQLNMDIVCSYIPSSSCGQEWHMWTASMRRGCGHGCPMHHGTTCLVLSMLKGLLTR